MKTTVKKSTKGSSASGYRKTTTMTGTKRPVTAAAGRARSPFSSFQGVIDSDKSAHQRDFLAQNNLYVNQYGAMDASEGKFTNQQMNRGSRGDFRLSGTMKMDQKDEIRVNPSPRRNKSKSPLRQNPPEVFSKSPRSHRHLEDQFQGMSQKSATKIGSYDEDRP